MSRISLLALVLVSSVALAADKAGMEKKPDTGMPAKGSMGASGTSGSMGATGATGGSMAMDYSKMTCGQVMADNAKLPAQMSELLNSVADMGEAHAKWAGKKDKAAKAESDAMMKVAKMQRDMAKEMKKTSETMASMKDLAPVEHDMKAMDPKMMELMQKVASNERAMAKLLTEHAQAMEQGMTQMKSGAGGN